MKFTDGYWCMKKEMSPLFAVEYADSRVQGSELTVYAPGKHISNRGDCLNLGMLTIRLSSPMEDVIKVSITHFEGTAYRGPFAQVEKLSCKRDPGILSFIRQERQKRSLIKGQTPGGSVL